MLARQQTMLRTFALMVCNWLSVLAVPVAGAAAWAGEGNDARPNEATAPPGNVVVAETARFTVLTPSLIRLEYDPSGSFMDAPSLVAAYRADPELMEQTGRVRLEVRRDDASIEIITDLLHLKFRPRSGPISSRNLEIIVKNDGGDIRWKPGDSNANLQGTAPTLAAARGPAGLGEGILSRAGYYLLDDSRTPVFTADGWAETRAGLLEQDFYFFGYGSSYERGLADFNLLSGRIPMPPEWALDLWLMCDWPLSASELLELVEAFRDRGIRVGALLIQHWSRRGYSSYDWNPRLFPDPEAFLAEAHRLGVRVGLLIHPGGALIPQDSRYEKVVEMVGWDPARRNRVFFDVSRRAEAEALTRVLLEPLERQGVDFWWADTPAATTIRRLGDQWWTNYLLFNRSRLPDGERGLILAPYGGLGSHRFPAGFAGMPDVSWDMLEYMTWFTATAGNVGMAYWAQVIQGCSPGSTGFELFGRWLQFGLFSPIMIIRTHKGDVPWLFDAATPEQVFFFLRYRRMMRRHIYSLAREAHLAGLPLVRPMYLHYPEYEAAYDAKYQYMLGRDVVVAPVARPSRAGEVLASRRVWFPPGEWHDIFTGRIVEGPALLSYPSGVNVTPVFVRSGGIIPMESEEGRLTLDVYAGESGGTLLYIDDGLTTAYRSGAGASCRVEYLEGENVRILRIGSWEGSYEGKPEKMSYEVRLNTLLPPIGVVVNGSSPPSESEESAAWWSYDEARSRMVVRTRPCSLDEPLEIVFAGDFSHDSRELAYRLREMIPRLDAVAILLRESKGPASLINEIGVITRRAELAALDAGAPPLQRELIAAEIDTLRSAIERVVAKVDQQILNEQVKLEFVEVLAGISLAARIIPSPYRQVILRTEVSLLPNGWGDLGGVVRVEEQPPLNLTLLEPGKGAFFESNIAIDALLLQELAFRVRAELVWNGLPLNLSLEQKLDNTFIKQYYVIGPFGDGSYRRMTQVGYPPERGIDLDATYAGKKAPAYWRKVPWQAPVKDYDGRDFRFVDFSEAIPPQAPAAGYAVTYVHVPNDVQARLLLGGRSGMVVWVNDTEVLSEPYMPFDRPDAVSVAVRLNRGWNEIRVKAVDEGERWGFFLRLLDEDGQPIPEARSGWGESLD